MLDTKKVMATKIQCRSMRRRLKFGHSYKAYKLDICHTYANLSTTMTIQMWTHARAHTNTPSQLEESNERLTNTQGLRLSSNKVRFYPCDYNVLMLNMVETT